MVGVFMSWRGGVRVVLAMGWIVLPVLGVCAECPCADLHVDDEARVAIYDSVLLRKWVL